MCRHRRQPSALRRHLVPWVQQTYPSEKYALWRTQHWPAPLHHQQLMVEFRFLADLPPFLPDFNLLDFSISSILQAKAQATPHSNLAALSPSINTEWDWLAGVYIRKTCRSFAATKKPPLRKMKFEVYRWLPVAKHTSSVLFRPKIRFNMTWEPIHGKKHFSPRLPITSSWHLHKHCHPKCGRVEIWVWTRLRTKDFHSSCFSQGKIWLFCADWD